MCCLDLLRERIEARGGGGGAVKSKDQQNCLCTYFSNASTVLQSMAKLNLGSIPGLKLIFGASLLFIPCCSGKTAIQQLQGGPEF